MNKSIFSTLLFFIIASLVQAHAETTFNRWQIYHSYVECTQIAEADDEVFVLADGALFSYTKSDNSIAEYNRLAGLNDSDINFICYDPTSRSLVITYQNQNIDILSGGVVYNLPDLKDKVLSADKSIQNLQVQNGKGYISTGFGTVVLDLKKKEIADSYVFNKSTRASLEGYGSLVLFTDDGVYACPMTDNTYDWNKWKHLSSKKYTNAVAFDGSILAIDSDLNIERIGSDWSAGHFTSGYRKIDVQKNRFVCFNSVVASVYESLTAQPTVIRYEGATAFSSANSNNFWITTEKGLAGYKLSGSDYVAIQEEVRPESPIVKTAYNMDFRGGRLIITPGGPFRVDDKIVMQGNLSLLEDGFWTNISYQDVLRESGHHTFAQLLSVAISPKDPTRFFVSTFRNGIFEFQDNRFVNRHATHNSTIVSNSESWTTGWISGMKFDAQGNLWALNSKTHIPMHMLNTSDKWFGYPISYFNQTEAIDRMVITQNNSRSLKVIISSYHTANSHGVVYDDNRTPELLTDDQCVRFKELTDQDGNSFNTLVYRCLAEDQDGKIWIGTESGLFLFNNPATLFSNNMSCYRIKVPRNDGTNLADFLLENELLTDILVDPANRKWIATGNNGLYLVSADGLETHHHFTKENSPLLSNSILSLAFDEVNGILYIGTDQGLMSYTTDAIAGKEDYSDVYAYPNPVRPEYTGDITITGLMHNSLVKITDIGNNLIYQGTSLGGQISWDGNNSKGKRVSSGVYLVYATSESGKKGVLTKILVVN